MSAIFNLARTAAAARRAGQAPAIELPFDLTPFMSYPNFDGGNIGTEGSTTNPRHPTGWDLLYSAPQYKDCVATNYGGVGVQTPPYSPYYVSGYYSGYCGFNIKQDLNIADIEAGRSLSRCPR